MGVRGLARDIILLYVGYRLIKIWFLKEEFTVFLGGLTIFLILITGWFLLEQTGVA